MIPRVIPRMEAVALRNERKATQVVTKIGLESPRRKDCWVEAI